MTDEEVLNYLGKYKSIKWSSLKNEIVDYLYNRYDDFSSIENINILKESYFRIKNNIDICPICKICGNKLAFKHIKYLKTCGSKKCIANECQKRREETNLKKYGYKTNYSNPENINKIKNTFIQKYGVDNPWKLPEIQNKCKNTIIKNNGGLGSASQKIKEKMKQTCLFKYGYEHNWQDPEEQKRSHSKEAKEKQKQTCLKRYGTEYASQSEIFKQHRKEHCLQKYGVTHEMKLPEFVNKINELKRKNHTFNSSIPEQKSYKLLKEKYPNVQYQYKSKSYPFACDFYISELDLYIECNYHWTHGGHPFNQNNLDDQKKLKLWKNKNTMFYNNAINTWTIRDVKKRTIAKQNHLNYLEFFSILDLENWLNEYETTK